VKWKVTLIALCDNAYRYKVTRFFPLYGVNETKLFHSKIRAEKQFKQWLQEGHL
jgi:hypothetical protein